MIFTGRRDGVACQIASISCLIAAAYVVSLAMPLPGGSSRHIADGRLA